MAGSNIDWPDLQLCRGSAVFRSDSEMPDIDAIVLEINYDRITVSDSSTIFVDPQHMLAQG